MTRDNVQIGMGSESLLQKIDWFFATRGMGVNPYALKRARLKQIIMLETASDEDLARIGLERDDILPHVFADLLSVH